jgi:hypothetical protein
VETQNGLSNQRSQISDRKYRKSQMRAVRRVT